jgi:hypothetical protein
MHTSCCSGVPTSVYPETTIAETHRGEFASGLVVHFDRPVGVGGDEQALVPERDSPAAVGPEHTLQCNGVDRYDADLATKRAQPEAAPLFGEWELRRLVRHRCTERQREVLLTAYEVGYYEWPRETDAQTLADDLGIASVRLHKHLRAAERKIVAGLFEGENGHSS